MGAIYNEIELYAATWLRNLEQAGHIAQGHVDERSIRELQPDDVRDATQAHFFAGIGVWSHALRLAGWPDELPVWTGSCPCQPFSGAGKRGGFSDERHLWPDWFRLISECRPPVIFGEQVAGPDGARWLDLVQADLEGVGYAFGASVLPAAGVGAPHIRHRIYWVAYSDEQSRGQGGALAGRCDQRGDAGSRAGSGRGGCARGMGNADREHTRRDTGAGAGQEGGPRLRAIGDLPGASGPVGGVGNVRVEGLEGLSGRRQLDGARDEGPSAERAGETCPGPTNCFWSGADWIPCRDGYSRPVEPGSFPLAHGAPGRVGPGGTMETQPRVGKLRAYGNAIVAPVAAAFIKAVMESLDAQIS